MNRCNIPIKLNIRIFIKRFALSFDLYYQNHFFQMTYCKFWNGKSKFLGNKSFYGDRSVLMRIIFVLSFYKFLFRYFTTYFSEVMFSKKLKLTCMKTFGISFPTFQLECIEYLHLQRTLYYLYLFPEIHQVFLIQITTTKNNKYLRVWLFRAL